MASGSGQDEAMDADNYQIDDEEMELMIRSMNTGGAKQTEYVEEGCSEDFDWGRMNDALGDSQPNQEVIPNITPSTSKNISSDGINPINDNIYNMTTIRDEIEKEEERKRGEQETERLKRKKEQEALEKARRKKIKFKPPGFNVLCNDSNQEPFRFFTFKNLCLVNDFGYTIKHKERGYTSESEIKDILSDPVQFIMHLSPETTSNLIHDKDDFEKICDYLVFCLASFYEDCEEKHEISSYDHFDMFKKALFDLLRNYGFSSFKLRLKYIFPCLLNLGFNEKVLLNEAHYLKALEDRINNVKDWFKKNKNKIYKWSFPKFHEFFVARQSNPPGSPSTEELEKNYKAIHLDDESSPVGKSSHDKILNQGEEHDDDKLQIPSRSELLRLQQIESIENFVELISDLIITFNDDPYVSWFLPSASNSVDWIDTLTIFHVFGSIASDKNLLINANVRKSIMTMFNTLIDSFDHQRWTGEKEKSKDEREKNKAENKDANAEEDLPFGAQCDIAEVLLHVGNQVDLNEEMKTWTKEEMPRNDMMVTIDHHHNMVNRIRLLPPTFRGNQVKKILAFMCLQQIIDPSNIDLTPTANINDAANTLSRNRHKFEALFDEHYIMINVIRLLDQIAGCEPLIDYVGKENRDGLEKVERILADYEAKKLKRNNAEAEPSRVKELLQQVTAKWKMMKQTSTESKRQPTIDKFYRPTTAQK